MAVLRVVSLVLAALTVAASSLFAQSDPMAKWRPKVGSIYLYDRHYSERSSMNRFDTTVHDTVAFRITSTDYYYDSAHPSVIVLDSNEYFWFHQAIDTQYQFTIETKSGPTGRSYNLTGATYKIKNYPDTVQTFLSSLISLYYASDGFYYPSGGVYENLGYYSVQYSPEIRWLYRWDGYEQWGWGPELKKYIPLDSYDYVRWAYTLIAADIVESSVASTNHKQENLISSDDKMIILNSDEASSVRLLDLLGRPIRSWQMPVEAGERRITLNVADVPSGVYFLRLTANGVDEVKKVVITH